MTANQDTTFQREIFLKDLSVSLALIDQAEAAGKAFADEGIEQLLLVGCGAPRYMFRAINKWLGDTSNGNYVADLYPAELAKTCYTPDARTAVIFGSHSGKTSDTVNGAESIRQSDARTMAITQHAESPLGKNVKQVVAYGSTEQGYFSSVILTLTLVSAFLQRVSPNWNLHLQLKSSMHNLPDALADAKEKSLREGIRHAELLLKANSVFVIGEGAMYTTAYIFAACFLMEMQRINAHPIKALDFFHGPFELLDSSAPIILLLGEGDTRPHAEHVRKFCDKYLGGCLTYDAASFVMPGIEPKIRAIAAPFIVDAALTNVVEQLAILRDFPLDTRRYMGKVDY